MSEHRVASLSIVRHRAAGLLAPAPGGARSGDSLESVVLNKDASGRVYASRRVSRHDTGAEHTTEVLRALLTRTRTVLTEVPKAPLQTVMARVTSRSRPDGDALRWSAWVLARLETVAGPVLVGTAHTDCRHPHHLWDGPLPDLPHSPPAEAPRDWAHQPLVLSPPVAAQVVAGARLALTSQAARQHRERFTGRRVFSGLGLTDLPAEHPQDSLDDRGRPALPLALADGGFLGAVPLDPDTGLPAGRAVWDHDTQRSGSPEHIALALTGPRVPVPPDALEIAWCAEGLQRYHADGVLRLDCLARPADGAGQWCRIRLRGKPLRILQAVRGLFGPAHTVHTDHTVTTASLVLPCARTLAEKGMATVAHP
ncbi:MULTISPECIES: hypothetical protein [unclassified Streptomyces]|uniref:hypothetical protein n=1 Tax=unclassified Streptomyces TaxID=2593676 RepID=UPI00332197B8